MKKLHPFDKFNESKVNKLEEHISYMLKWYPSLYDSKYGRIKLLAHMFLSYGAGYKWSKGELVIEKDSEEEIINTRKRRHESEKEEWSRKIDLLRKTIEPLSQEMKQGEEVQRINRYINHLQSTTQDNFNPYGTEYPDAEPYVLSEHTISHYSPILNIPKDITTEYLNGAIEILEYVIEKGCVDKRLLKVHSEINRKDI
jgi:hypothetical protein